MKLLNSSQIYEITKEMGKFDTETLVNSNKYIIKPFSVFDHWLTDEEAQENMMFYGEVEEKINTPQYFRYIEYEEKLLKFYHNVYMQTAVYGVSNTEEGDYKLIQYDNIDEYISYALLSIREQVFLKIVLPNFFTVIEGGHDLTHILYTLRSREEKLSQLYSLITSSELFLLS